MNLPVEKTKIEIRRLASAKRDALSADQRVMNSLLIAALGVENILFEPGIFISAFLPIKSEVDPRPLIHNLCKRGATICLPAVVDQATLVFRQFMHGKKLIKGSFGPGEPGPETKVLDPLIILAPLLAFDDRGHRLGYGGGYYDRAIAGLMNRGIFPKIIGLAFDCQKFCHVPKEAHDIVMHAIITESGYRKFDVEG